MPQVLIIRHADAVPLGTDDILDDESRPLSDLGRVQATRLAKALQRLEHRPDRIFVSPLIRAQETADGLNAVWNLPADCLITTDRVRPDFRPKRLERLLAEKGAEISAVIGHEPDLSQWAARLIGSKKAQLFFDKSSCALVHFDGEPQKGEGRLIWLIGPEWAESNG